jgi:hypothetical protein
MTQSSFKRILIIGGNSAIAAECAKLWLAAGTEHLMLWGRNALKLERTANDLRTRAPTAQIEAECIDFVSATAIKTQADCLVERFMPDLILIAHGALIDQTECQSDIEACAQSLTINALSPALFAEAFAVHLADKGKGTLVIISSVAGDRGRRSNYVYGAAKGLLNRYAQGLQHRFAGTAIKVVLVKPGPTATPMTTSLMQTGQKMAAVDAVAVVIVNGIAKGKAVIYAPAQWWLIMMIIRHLPAMLFNKLNI